MALSFLPYAPSSLDRCSVCRGPGDLSEWVSHSAPEGVNSGSSPFSSLICRVHLACVREPVQRTGWCPGCLQPAHANSLPSRYIPGSQNPYTDVALVYNTSPSRFTSVTFLSNGIFLILMSSAAAMQHTAVRRGHVADQEELLVCLMLGTIAFVANALFFRLNEIRSPQNALVLGGLVTYIAMILPPENL